MKSWNRATLGNTQYQETHVRNNHMTTRPNYDPRASFGSPRVYIPTSPNRDYRHHQRLFTSPNQTSKPNLYYHQRSIQELKASGETTNTVTSRDHNQPIHQIEVKSHLKMDQIGCLLSEFKSKFASIQQKYSKNSKELPCSNNLKCQPVFSQNLPRPAVCTSPSNKMFLKSKNCQCLEPTYDANISGNTLKSVEDHRFDVENPKSTPKEITEEVQKPSMIEQALEKKVADRSKFRATFGPTQTKSFQVPIRKIREAEEVTTKTFTNCKKVQSETESNQDQEDGLKESIVICKYQSGGKLRRTSTIDTKPQSESQQSNKDMLRRFKSVKVPFRQQI